MKRNALSSKVLVLGIDGMDPMTTKRFMAEGKLPNVKKLIERASAREDLAFMGNVPTITPPIWTTLATGSCPGSHGITCFWNQSKDSLDTMVYALDSRKCKDEPVWNIFADAGFKTLVWHWPGSSWPPTSQNPNLSVVDGTQPVAINTGAASTDWEKLVYASEKIDNVQFQPRIVDLDNGAGCIINDLNVADSSGSIGALDAIMGGGKSKEVKNIMLSHEDGELSFDKVTYDFVNSPIKEAKGWANAPEGAKEFIVLTSDGSVRRPCLVLKNEEGIFDKIAIYKSKKEAEPLAVWEKDVFINCYLDEVRHNDNLVMSSRAVRVLELAEDGSSVKIWLGKAMDIACDTVWHPKSLYKDILENVGYCPANSLTGGNKPELADKCVIPGWDYYCEWQAKALNYLIKEQGYEIIFSHVHNIDDLGHKMWFLGKGRSFGNDEELYQSFIERAYLQTDRYIGEFLHLLDEDWTIFIVSDHGLIVTDEEEVPLLGDAFGVNVRVLEELGYTVLEKDQDGNDLKEIDWTKTRAVAPRGGHIYINLKGRDATGIVDPADKYALEEEIIDSLYNYREPHTGKRIVSLVLRNKDAAILGVFGPECGDLIYFINEGFNRLHGDSLSTCQGYKESSVAPIFISAGKGIKENYTINRLIRQVDLAPTIAAMTGIRMPKNSEGGIVHQIFVEEF